MSRKISRHAFTLTVLAATAISTVQAAEPSSGQQAVQSASEQNKYAFILFYRANDAATGRMHQTITSALAERTDSVTIPVQVRDQKEHALIRQFDASRLPMPAVAVLAPNGAVTSVFPRKVAASQLTAAIVSPGQAKCLKALQDRKIVLLCVQPEQDAFVPDGIKAFQQDELYKDRTAVVHVRGGDADEGRFLKQLKLPNNKPTPVVAMMAPPGVMLGTYDSNVTLATLGQRLAAAGKCCDDPNCKHRQAGGRTPAQR